MFQDVVQLLLPVIQRKGHTMADTPLQKAKMAMLMRMRAERLVAEAYLNDPRSK